MTTMTSRPALRWAIEPALRLAAAAVLLGVCATLAQAAGVTQPFQADFNVHRGRIPLGTMTFALKDDRQPRCYVYSGEANPNTMAGMFVGKITEESRFCIDDAGVLRPQLFRHHIDGKKDDSYTLNFDWARHQAVYQSEDGQRKTVALGARAYDPLSLQIAARHWLAHSSDPSQLGTAEFPLVDEDKIKDYKLRVAPGGTIDTPGGRFDTLLVERVDDKKRHLRFWLARGANWIPVRVEHQKKDDSAFRMNLTQLKR